MNLNAADSSALAGLMDKALEYLNEAIDGQAQIQNFFAKLDMNNIPKAKENVKAEIMSRLIQHAKILDPESQELEGRCSQLADLVVTLIFSDDVLKLIA